MHLTGKIAAVGLAVTAACGLAVGSASASTNAQSPLALSARLMTLNKPGDGLDPAAAGCANDAVQSAGSAVQTSFGLLELRWSPSCKTNWGRFLPSRSGFSFTVSVYRLEDSQWCGDQTGNGCNSQSWDAPIVVYSNQLYGCNYNMKARVVIHDGTHYYTYQTPYIGGC